MTLSDSPTIQVDLSKTALLDHATLPHLYEVVARLNQAPGFEPWGQRYQLKAVRLSQQGHHSYEGNLPVYRLWFFRRENQEWATLVLYVNTWELFKGVKYQPITHFSPQPLDLPHLVAALS